MNAVGLVESPTAEARTRKCEHVAAPFGYIVVSWTQISGLLSTVHDVAEALE